MDDFAHALLGYVLFRFVKLAGGRAGKKELAAAIFASLLPDILWVSGIASYAAAHTLAYYIIACTPFFLFARTRTAAVLFSAAASIHIVADALMHERATMPFAPFSDFAIVGTFNYWEVWWAIPAYWLSILLLLAFSLYLEKKKEGKIAMP
ncbi:MAG: metal-dependent hydrolase [Candidatus Micrarchaeota archaeon]|nr:metal-dependent hydrolase [Candidatus Micrarchaeota archaeon]